MLKQDELDAALAPARSALRWGIACSLAAAAFGMAVDGPRASAAALIGGITGTFAGRSLASGLAAAFGRPEDVRGARNRTLLAALLRYPLLGAIFAGSIMLLDLPAAWLAVGVTTWPVSLLAAAWQSQAAESSSRA